MTEDAWGKKLWDYRKNLGVSRKKFAEMLHINEGTLRSYETLQRKPGFETYEKIEAIINQSGENRKDNENMNELLRTKDKLIASLEREKALLEKLNNKEIPVDNLYGDLNADIVFQFEIEFNWSLTKPGVKVKYLSQDSRYIPIMAKKLGYTESEIIDLLQIDEMVEYKDHNIHKLRSKEQKKEMLGIMDNFMKAYNAIKVNTTLLVAEIPVLYTHKNGTIYKANVEYRVNWIKGTGTAHIRWCNE